MSRPLLKGEKQAGKKGPSVLESPIPSSSSLVPSPSPFEGGKRLPSTDNKQVSLTTQVTQTQDLKGTNKEEVKDVTRDPKIIRFKTHFINTILDVLKARGWQQVHIDDPVWDFYWADVGWIKEFYGSTILQGIAKVNHFRNFYELTRKDYMIKNLKKFKRSLEKENPAIKEEMDFFPLSFQLPSDYRLFVEEYKKNPSWVWIMKPATRAQGKGIFLITKLADVLDWKQDHTRFTAVVDEEEKIEDYVCQRYIANPYLVGGKKFDLRLYLLVTSFQPLVCWLYRGGFARFSGMQYSSDRNDITNTVIHLTNVAIQKTAEGYDPSKGCKWQLHQLKAYLITRHGAAAVEELFKKIENIFLKSVQAVQKIIINDRHCFELYGFDVLLDDTLKPWILEINASPSLTADTPTDYFLKIGLLDDMLTVVDMENRRTGKETSVGGFDLLWNDGPVPRPTSLGDDYSLHMHDENPSNGVLGGYLDDRDERIRSLFAATHVQRSS